MTNSGKPARHRDYYFIALLAVDGLLVGFVVKETIPGLKEIPWIGVAAAVAAAVLPSVLSQKVREIIWSFIRPRLVSLVRNIINQDTRYYLIMTFLFIIMIASLYGTILIVRCMYVRLEYKSLIYNCLTSEGTCEENLRRAFVLNPWRIEAPLLIARKEYLMTASHQDGEFHKWVKTFCSHPDVKKAVDNAYGWNTYHCCIAPISLPAVLQNPLLWYASLLPEADALHETAYKESSIAFLQTVLGKLDTETAAEATLLKLKIEMDIGRNRVIQLEEETKRAYSTRAGSHYYQEAMDTLAQVCLLNHQVDEALKHFGELLEIRVTARTSADQVWLRRPNKLFLYQLFHFYRNSSHETGEMANYIKAMQIEQPEFDVRFRREFIEVSRFAAFGAASNDAWLDNTFLGNEGNRENIEKYLQKGWRF
ncbi:MAG: hypothetical protein WC405_08750 [Syntrophales bacterium]